MNAPNPDSKQIDLNTGFLRLWTQHEQALRALVRSCVPRTAEVDEVMQTVGVVAWQKYTTLNDPEKFGAWVAMIARYEVIMARRRVARDRLVLDEDIIAKLAEEGAEEMPLRHRQLDALDGCVAKLPEERRKLALAAYSPGASMKDLATQTGRTEGSLYQLIARIRMELSLSDKRRISDIVSKNSEDGSDAFIPASAQRTYKQAPNSAGWEKARVELRIPPGSKFLLLSLRVHDTRAGREGRKVYGDRAREFPGHFVDDIQVYLICNVPLR